MVLIKKYYPKIPSFRFKKTITIFDNSFFFFKILKKKNINLIKRKKKFYLNKTPLILKKKLKFLSIFTDKILYSLKPYKMYIACKTVTNERIYIPGIDMLNVGKVLRTLDKLINNFKLIQYTGILISINKIPLTVIFCNVTNFTNDKITYAKSSGTYCKTKKTKKNKKKLILVILPSLQEIFLTKISLAFIGKNKNFFKNKLIEGKWGYSNSQKKKLV